jgi:hypothetical protein
VISAHRADRFWAVGVAVLALLFAARAVSQVASPVPLDFGEGVVWACAHLLQTRGTYFLPIATDPYLPNAYPPLFPQLLALAGGTLQAGRAIAILCAAAAAAAFGGLLVGLGLSPRRAAAWSLVLLATPAVHEWAALCRVDTLMLALTLTGLLVASRERPRGRLPAELLAVPLFVGALLAKQTAFAGPAAVLYSLLRRGERRRALVFMAACLTLLAAACIVFFGRDPGEAWNHLFVYHASLRMRPGAVVVWTLRFCFEFPVMLPLALAALWHGVPYWAPAYAAVALCSLVMTAKAGSDINYLIEPSTAVVLLGAVAAERLRKGGSRDRAAGVSLLLLVQLAVLCGPERPIELGLRARARAPRQAMVRVLSGAHEPVLSDDPSLVAAAGKEPRLEPFALSHLARAGLWDPEPLLLRLRQREFSVVVTGLFMRDIPGLTDALREGYEPREEAGPFVAWRRREPARPSAGASGS